MSCTGLLRFARVSIPGSVHTTVKQFPITCLRRRYGWRNVHSEYICIFCSCSICCIWCHCFVFYHCFWSLHRNHCSIFKPKHLKGDDSELVYIDSVNQEFNGFFFLLLFVFSFYSIHILFCIKTISKWRIYLHAKTFKLKLKMWSFIFRRQPLVTK